jgi:hypothetical protein
VEGDAGLGIDSQNWCSSLERYVLVEAKREMDQVAIQMLFNSSYPMVSASSVSRSHLFGYPLLNVNVLSL